MACDRRRPARAAGHDPLRDGPCADMHLRICQTLAWRGAEFGELAAYYRLVHLLPYHSWFHLLWLEPAALSALALARPTCSRDGDRRRLGTARKLQFHYRTLSCRDDLTGLLRRQHHHL